jgi:predicted secreted Zn-dependent protease
VFAFFVKRTSWKIEAANGNILKHEQGHFDITEVFCRKLKKELSKIIPLRSSVQLDVNALFQQINLANDRMQEKYDEETDYGRDPKAQRRWSKFIHAELTNSL